jgi:glycosyltransferase involved in cell wall biosynthesis
MYKIIIFLVTHNRPILASKALESILNQTYTNFELVISDNSTNDVFKNFIHDNYINYKNIIYIHRQPSLTGVDHFNQVIKESINFDFAVFFHDDDIMQPNYLEEILNSKLLNNIECTAIGVNAFIINKESISSKLLFYSHKILCIKSKKELINHYFNLEYHGAAPFPGYIYRVKYLQNQKLDFEAAGKHSDLLFLLNLLDKGYIFWLNKPLMNYRLHENNDTKTINLFDRNNLYTLLTNQNLITNDIKLDYNLMVLKELYYNKMISYYKFLQGIILYLFRNTINFRIIKIINARLIKYTN